MAPVANLYRLVFGGSLFTDEQWTCSLHIDANQYVTTLPTAFQPALVAWMTRVDSHVNQQAHLDFIKFNRVVKFVLPTGKFSMRYADPVTVQHLQANMAAGTFTTGYGQLANVVTLRTALARGRASKGRIYVPNNINTPDPDGRIGVADATAMAASAATLIRDLNTVLVGQGNASVVVFSNVGQVVNNVQSVAVGRVVDTMRSRRSSLNEAHFSAPVNP